MSFRNAIPLAELPDNLPDELGRYRLIRPVGRGGMGVVFEAKHVHLQRKVALKVLRRELAGDRRSLDRFYREIRALGKVINNNHVILATDGGEESGVPFLTMEFVEGMNLDQVQKLHGGKLAPPLVCEMIRQASLGLDAIHQHGLVHRDLKPTNLMLTPDGVVKILDLGLVRLQADEEDRAELTPTIGILGTLDFQAPEQALNARAVDIRADIYSLGCTFFKLLAGRAPYGEFERYKKIDAHADMPVPALPDSVPEAIRAIVVKMMAKEPQQRYQTPMEVVEAVSPFAEPVALATENVAEPANPQAPTPAPMTTPVNSIAKATTAHADAMRVTEVISATPSRRRYRTPAWIIVLMALPVLGLMADLLLAPRAVDRPKPAAKAIETPAPVRPASLNEFKPLECHFLLDFEPTAVLWKPRNPGSSYRHEPAARKLSVTCAASEHALFNLGKTTAASYELQMRIFQPDWIGGFGVYLGYRTLAEPRPLFVKSTDLVIGEFQALYFQQRDVADDAGQTRNELSVHRLRCEHYRKPNGKELVLPHDQVPPQALPPLNNEQTLTLVVENHRLTGVLLGKLPPMSTLLAKEYNGFFDKELHQGELGVWVCGTSADFRDASFRVTKK